MKQFLIDIIDKVKNGVKACKNMSENNFFRTYYQIIASIEYCIGQKFIIPALILIYSAIDSISWIADEENQTVGIRFQKWVDFWMLNKYPLPCSAVELYAARCGILHTLTPDSDLSKNKNVRRISYAWGAAKQEDLEESINRVCCPRLVAIHINDLFRSFKFGLKDYINMLDANSSKKDSFLKKSNYYFANMDISTLNEFLAYSRKSGE